MRARAGRLVLAAADADRSPQLVQAFQAQAIPTVVAARRRAAGPALRGRAARRRDRAGVRPAPRARRAARRDRPRARRRRGRGAEARRRSRSRSRCRRCTRRRSTRSAAATSPPRHPRTARPSRRTRATTSPVAGLAQANLLGRLQGKTLDEIRNRAASAPDDLDAQLDVADLDLSGGHVDDAFDRLLDAVPEARRRRQAHRARAARSSCSRWSASTTRGSPRHAAGWRCCSRGPLLYRRPTPARTRARATRAGTTRPRAAAA